MTNIIYIRDGGRDSVIFRMLYQQPSKDIVTRFSFDMMKFLDMNNVKLRDGGGTAANGEKRYIPEVFGDLISRPYLSSKEKISSVSIGSYS